VRDEPLAAREASRAPSPRAAVAFLTRLPVGGGALTARQLSRAALWFPRVGLLVGGVMGGASAGGTVLDPGPATALALLAAMLVTGALHEDGLADTADAIGAHVPRERRLEILRDSRVGTYRALALVFAFVFPLVVLTPLDDGDFRAPRSSGTSSGAGRSSRIAAAGSGASRRRGCPDARGRATTFGGRRLHGGDRVVAGRPAAGAVALGVGALLTLAAVPVFRRTLGGATGDTRSADQGR
jgi:adenosylcobinamide-GDP ribazoletransferase